MAMTENGKIEQYGPIVSLIQSKSDPDKKPYEIRTKNGVVHTCSCTAWIMDRKKAEAEGRLRTCKHIKFYLGKKEAHDARLAAGIEAEKKIISEIFAACGLVGKLREFLGNGVYEQKLTMMAQHLKPHIGGKSAATIAAELEVDIMCAKDDLRVLIFDD